MDRFSSRLLILAASAALVLGACTHGDPPPARMTGKRQPSPPASRANDPHFDPPENAYTPSDIDTGSKPSSSSRTCIRTCPAGSHCEFDQGVEKCVSDSD